MLGVGPKNLVFVHFQVILIHAKIWGQVDQNFSKSLPALRLWIHHVIDMMNCIFSHNFKDILDSSKHILVNFQVLWKK